MNSLEGFLRHFLRLYRPLITSLNELLSPFELSYSLWQVIHYVKNNGSSTLVDISTYYEVEKPTITRRVHRLEELQIVKQIPGTDRREKIIQLTDRGEEIYQVCRSKITDLENSVTEEIPKETQYALLKWLPQIRENILNKEGRKDE
ncbi:MarR family winged helix-turn-helix transcriptional regulator [Sporosarcina soli]|uniref:MarR family winged helix-turn-helix transcriptional regulator n=1 Tax=Sporosarcina soli TaxID=334736 RepID=A0ABW0TH04_9BACL